MPVQQAKWEADSASFWAKMESRARAQSAQMQMPPLVSESRKALATELKRMAQRVRLNESTHKTRSVGYDFDI